MSAINIDNQFTYVTKRVRYNISTGMISSVEHRINNNAWMSLKSLTYDNFGRLIKKLMAGTRGGGFSEEYTYNIRGQLTGINPNYVTTGIASASFGPYFGEKIYYDRGFASQLYDGNVSGIEWRGGPAAGSNKQFYGYTYDNCERLLHAEYGIWDNSVSTYVQNDIDHINYTTYGIEYDKNGNLLAMNHIGPMNGSLLSTNPIVYTDMDILTYTYKYKTNQLDYVSDGVGHYNSLPSIPDFRDMGAVGGNYDYDANGNVIKDLNKGLTIPIIYSIWDKPLTVSVNNSSAGTDKIEYIYDATGRKLQKIVTTGSALPVIWDYVGEFVWKDNDLQYVLNDEGRCRPRASTTYFDYDYFLKDHLNNVRAVVGTQSIPYYPPIQHDLPLIPTLLDPIPTGGGTTTPSGWNEPTIIGPINYTATMEVAAANTEALIWGNIDSVRELKPLSTNLQDIRAALLSASDDNKRIGTAIMLRVMTGDKFDLSASSYFPTGNISTSSNSTAEDLAASLLTTLTGGTSNSVPVSESAENMEILQNSLTNPNFISVLGNLQSQETIDSTKPLSFLNYIIFDDDFNAISAQSGAKQITGVGQWSDVNFNSTIDVAQPGYILAFTSNSSIAEAYWDQVNLVLYKGNVMEETHYYPFGLTISSTSSNPNEKNNYKLTTKELQDDFKLNWYDFGARMQDMQTGRWLNIDPLAEKFSNHSPYNFCTDNPIKFIDPDGRAPWVPDVQEGQLVVKAEAGDNAQTLSTFLHVDQNKANQLYNSRDKNGTVKLTDDVPGVVPINAAIKDTRDHPENYSSTGWFADPNYNCFESAYKIGIGGTPDFKTPRSSDNIITKLETNFELAGNNLLFGRTIATFDADEIRIFGNSIDHAATYLGTSNNNTKYFWSKDGGFTKPSIRTLEQLVNKYGDNESLKAEDNKGYYNTK